MHSIAKRSRHIQFEIKGVAYINAKWKNARRGGCEIIFVPEFHEKFTKGDNVAFAYPPNTIKRAYVSDNDRFMHVNTNSSRDAISHEVGHLMRARDHYTDNPDGSSTPSQGWENDIMWDNRKMPTKSIDEMLDRLGANFDCK